MKTLLLWSLRDSNLKIIFPIILLMIRKFLILHDENTDLTYVVKSVLFEAHTSSPKERSQNHNQTKRTRMTEERGTKKRRRTRRKTPAFVCAKFRSTKFRSCLVGDARHLC